MIPSVHTVHIWALLRYFMIMRYTNSRLLHFVLGWTDLLLKSGTSQHLVLAVVFAGGPSVSTFSSPNQRSLLSQRVFSAACALLSDSSADFLVCYLVLPGDIFRTLITLCLNHDVRHQSSAVSVVHRRHKLGRPAAAFLPLCVISDARDKCHKRLCVGMRVKVWNFEHLI